MVALPISMPHTQVMVYGIELTGDTPRSDLTEMAIPSVMMRNPVTYTRNRTKILVSFVSCFIFMPLYFRFLSFVR